MEKIRKVSLAEAIFWRAWSSFWGLILFFFEIFTVFEEKFMPSNAQKYEILK
jgi:hypothetical protein